ncbi:MAG: N5-glutamine methyltransferase family protein, partial [Syntrophothermus sp.]
MENKAFSPRFLFLSARKELAHLYDEREIDQILFLLLEHLKGWNKISLHAKLEENLPIDDCVKLSSWLEQLQTGMPVQYIIGKVDFAGVKIGVNPSVLIPRPETGELVEFIINDQIQKLYTRFTLLDLCTGSGSIPIALAKKFPGLIASGIDISAGALATARENADLNSVHVEFQQSDILDRSRWAQFPMYDIIVSNPPYVPEKEKEIMQQNVLRHEPWEALFVPDEDPLVFYREISAFSFLHLN